MAGVLFSFWGLVYWVFCLFDGCFDLRFDLGLAYLGLCLELVRCFMLIVLRCCGCWFRLIGFVVCCCTYSGLFVFVSLVGVCWLNLLVVYFNSFVMYSFIFWFGLLLIM